MWVWHTGYGRNVGKSACRSAESSTVAGALASAMLLGALLSFVVALAGDGTSVRKKSMMLVIRSCVMSILFWLRFTHDWWLWASFWLLWQAGWLGKMLIGFLLLLQEILRWMWLMTTDDILLIPAFARGLSFFSSLCDDESEWIKDALWCR